MNPKPSDLFIGVVDFFSVILPGAMLTFFLKGKFYADLFGEGKVFPAPASDTQGWIIFLLATYIVGNLIFVIASWLDGLVYDKLLRNVFFKKNFDLSYAVATAIRDKYIPRSYWIDKAGSTKRTESYFSQLLTVIGGPFAGVIRWLRSLLRIKNPVQDPSPSRKLQVINTFKWAQHYLSIKYPDSLIDVKKFEADSKFFRSLVIAFVILSLALLHDHRWLLGISALGLSVLSLIRYGDLRYKSTERAYELIITINHLEVGSIPGADEYPENNRSMFLAGDDVVAVQAQRTATLTKGVRGSARLLAIPAGQTWKMTNSALAETLICLEGEGLAETYGDDGKTIEGRIIIAPGAIVPLPPKSSFGMTNRQHEPLLILSVK